MFYTNPRYILFIHLVMNDLIHVNVTIMLFVLSYTIYRINICMCWVFLLMALVSTENSPLNLAFMALECYSAVCFPLQHLRVWTIKRTLTLILLMWTTTMVSATSDLVITLATEHLTIIHSKVFCLRHTAFPHNIITKKRDITYAMFLLIIWITIFYTYLQILLTAKTAGKDAAKARNTIILHSFQLLLCMASYLRPVLTHLLQQRFPENSTDILFMSYIVVQVLPRSASPVIYGLRDPTFRKYLKRYMLAKP